MDAREELRAAVDGLYSAFRPYRLRDHIVDCPCCVSDGDNRKLQSVPLLELTSEQLRRYTGKAMTTWGTAHEFRHFLPRIAELMSFDEGWQVDLEIVAGKLTYADWSSWPGAEQSAIRRFLAAWWQAALREFPCPYQWQSIDQVLCAIGRTEDRLDSYLSDWLRPLRSVAMQHLADFVIYNGPSLCKERGLSNSFWTDRPQQAHQVESWMRMPQTRDAIAAAVKCTPEDDAQLQLLQAIEYLELLKPA